MFYQAPTIAPGGRVVVSTGPFGAPERAIDLKRPMTVAEVVAIHGLAFRLPTVAVMADKPVMRGTWALRVVRPGDVLGFVAVPRGGGDSGSGKQIIGLVAALALSIAAPFVGSAIASTFFGGSLIASSLASAAFLPGGSLLLNWNPQCPPS
ncbi:MAG TPA: hypothetical protein VGM83_05820 [Devosiaceae bacterium]|jgi:sulfur carrier protein ThiS